MCQESTKLKTMTTASIVTYKTNPDELKKVLTCAINSIIDTVYVVDNSPADELKTVSNFSEKIRYIFNGANLGYGKAHNIAIRHAIEKEAKYHVVINPDIYFDEGAIESLSDFMDGNDDVGQVMPKIIYPDGEIQYLCKLLPTPGNLFGRRFLFAKKSNKINRQYELRDTKYDKLMEIPSLSGCFMFMRIDTLLKTGGFDERYFMYLEDVDLCRRIGKVSKTCFFPLVYVVHEYNKGSYKNKDLLKYHIVSAIKYFNKWGWFFDKERKAINLLTLRKLGYK
jgi:GT2 family glycosyltransferase